MESWYVFPYYYYYLYGYGAISRTCYTSEWRRDGSLDCLNFGIGYLNLVTDTQLETMAANPESSHAAQQPGSQDPKDEKKKAIRMEGRIASWQNCHNKC